jgi:putative endonuclease
MGSWFVYLLRCADGTLYTGVTADARRRLAEHNGGRCGARYTRTRRPVELVHLEVAQDRSAAFRREAAIRRMDRQAKLALCGCGGGPGEVTALAQDQPSRK